jgi:hypothetical protein
MKHTEYKLTVSKPILEIVSPDLSAVHYEIGSIITLDTDTYIELKKGNTITRYTGVGLVRFTKKDFENEVRTITVTVEESSVKLGNR